ncbi:response regulator [Rhodomicrobium sp. R_RK_3]|uniref:response regulator n=1 Tax=Rhodomicrobium sp. R_RK_3 TaxID=2029567 RepID=UPI000B4B086A|nr:response regulator [Rhodomicrobium sp. R_RK_3]
MIQGRSNPQSTAQFLSRDPQDRTPIRRLVGFVAAMLGAVVLAIALRDQAAALVMGVFALLAAVGVAALFSAAAGFLHFGLKAQGTAPDLSRIYAEYASQGVAVTNKDGSTLYANSAYRQLTGATDQAPFSVESALVRHFGGSEPLFRLIRAARRGEPAHEEFQALGSLGAGRWLRASVRQVAPPKELGSSEPLSLWEIADVSARRQQDGLVADHLRRFRKLLDEAPVGIFLAGPDGGVSFANATLRSWIDLGDPETGARLDLASIFHDQAAAMLSPGPTGDEPLDASFDIVKRDGTAMPVSVRLTRHKLENDEEETEIFGAVLERQADADHAALHNDTQRLLSLLRPAPVPIAAIAKDGTITSANAAFARFFGAAKSLENSSLFSLADPAAGERLQQALDKAAARKVSIPPVDISAIESKRTGRLFFSPISRTAGSDGAALVFGIDTSEQRMLEEQIAQSQKMQAIGQLAGGIAHDFNNVLTAIIGFSDLLLANHRPSDPSFADLMNIKNNANRAAGLVRHLLAFSRKQTLRPQVMSLTDAMEDLMVLLGQLLGEKVAAKVVHGRDLWLIKVDPTQFQQVIINLAVNARDAMTAGGELTIRTANISERESAKLGVAGMEPGEYVLCEVSDTGTGIPPEVMDKIFEPFFSTKEVGKGTGLGLSTVYGIVKQTGGYISAESEVGSGTIFRIYLPRCEDVIAPEAVAEKPAKREAARDLTGSATVLLVEDEDAVRSFAARALSTRGYRVFEAASGVQALDVMNEHGGSIDLVVSDVVMPEMDGPTLLKHLRKANPAIKIIFISGYAEEAFRNNLNEDERFTFLPKPFSLKKLAAAVKETLESD